MSLFVIKRKKVISILALIFALVITSLIVFTTGAHNVFSANAVKELPIYYVKTDQKKVAISFDCAWGVDYTDKLLAIMKTEKVTCTFFMVEFWTNKHPDYVKKIIDNGHEIGTHSATHPYMSKLKQEDMLKELTTSINAIESITNKKVNLFRAPYGDYSNKLLGVAKSLGLYTIQWSIDSLDWKNLSSTEITNRVTKNLKNGDIILFHNQGLHTHEALQDIIKIIKQKGYSIVPISQLIYKDNYRMLSDGGQELIS